VATAPPAAVAVTAARIRFGRRPLSRSLTDLATVFVGFTA